jgi:hypothetical protein
MGIFDIFLGSNSLECPKAPLVHWQMVLLPIFSGGVGLISLKVIAPIACLKSWALVAPIIVSKFLPILVGGNRCE